MSRNIRSLCYTTHSNERYVPITGYRRHNYTRAKYINSLDLHKYKLLFQKMNQESQYQVRSISFFLVIQKSVKNGTKNSLKKLTSTTLRPTNFESFFCKFEVIASLFTKLATDSKKIVHFSRKGCRLPNCLLHTVKASHCPFCC